MALPSTIQDRDFRNFDDNGDGTTSRWVKIFGGSSGGAGGLLEGVVYNHVSGNYPDAVTEIYTLKNGGSGGTVTAVVTVVYTDSTKKRFLTVDRV